MSWDQALSLLGAACILAAYAMQHHPRWKHLQIRYAALNIAGSASLLLVAILNTQYGFIVLQAAWLFISLFGLKSSLAKK